MPSGSEHLDKYSKNKALLLDNALSIDTTTYYDWVGIIAFYSAMHLVQKVMAESPDILPADKQPTNHHECMAIVRKYDVFKGIKNTYKVLLDLSWAARYSPRHLSKDEAQKALNNLQKIESQVLPSN